MKRGLSLLEVIIALAILAGSAAVLAQMMNLAQRAAFRATDVTEAQTLCQNLLNELLIGTLPWESVEQQPIDPFLPWEYTLLIEPLGDGKLASVTITVTQLIDEQLDLPEADTPAPPQFRLTRWVYRPDGEVDPLGEPTLGRQPSFESGL